MGDQHPAAGGVICPIRESAARDPAAVAVEGPVRAGRDPEVLTYAELDARVEAEVEHLERARLMPDRTGRRVSTARAGVPAPPDGQHLTGVLSAVVTTMTNGVDLIVLLFACLRSGLAVVPLSPRLPDAELQRRVRSLRTAASTGAGPISDAIQLASGEPVIVDTAIPTSAKEDAVTAGIWTILFTSGSSGAARAAALTYSNHFHSAAGSATNIPLEAGDRWMLSLPLSHVGGVAILIRCFLAGATVVLPESPGTVHGELRTGAVTHVSLVSTQLKRFLAQGVSEAPGIPGLKAILLGGSAMPVTLVRHAIERGLPVHVSYGSTEMASQIATTGRGDSPATITSTSGRVLPGREVRIAKHSEILVRGATRFLGYVTPAGLEKPFDKDGWFRTGDLGHFDSAERLVIEGRRDNMFVSGGENIQPEAIERALLAVSGVTEAVVVPVPDPEWGFRPGAFLGGEWDAETVVSSLREVLPGFMVPERFQELPASQGLKPDRKALAALAGNRKSKIENQ